MYYVNLFFIFSILGFIFENIFINLIKAHYDSGILFGPWTPVYGFGVIVIILIYKFLNRYLKKEWLKATLLFLLSALILSILEFFAGTLIENIFGKVFWNYEEYKYNLGKYVSLEVASIWGVFSLIIVYLVKKPMDKLIKKIPKWLSYVLIGLFIIDGLLTLVIK